MNVTVRCVARALNLRCCCRWYSEKPLVANKNVIKEDPSLIRNIGILAHIDAGKTTTTERMLFYSGAISQMGEVHHGNTVTDFMDQERERGITITAASVTFPWERHKINLLDTPGHIDFTMEVEQTLNVMDGAVIVLDGVAGVEAQTVTVWRQADKHKIPRIVYINKMDRPDAGFFRSVNSIRAQLHVTPVILQLPLVNESKVFNGVVDLLRLEKFEWSRGAYTQKALTEEDGKLWENAVAARVNLTETLADLDDKMAEAIISDEKKLETITSEELRDSIRKVTIEQKGFPILCGSSYKKIGVQLLMDAVIHYLPSPLINQSGKILKCFEEELCARAFKVRHDEKKGPITFLRVYSGTIFKSQKVFNVNNKKSEQCGRIYIAYADDYEEVNHLGVGNIAAVTGLKVTKTGELITSSPTACAYAKSKILANKDSFKDFDFEGLVSGGPFVPDPVFFCSIEAPSLSHQAALEKALSELEKEDPSLRVSVNPETGQTILGGMGELHIDIIRERIKREYNVDADLGPLQIAYKEALVDTVRDTYVVKRQIGRHILGGSSVHSVSIEMSVLKSGSKREKETLLLDKSPECVENISSIFPKHLLAVKNGIESALSIGPKLFSPVINVNVMLHHLEVGKGTSDSFITSATVQCTKKLLKKGGTRLLEPIMAVEVVCTDKMFDQVLEDLGRRRAELVASDSKGLDIVVRALVPLSELLGYASDLRILTSGMASFTMEFHNYRDMSQEEEAKAVKSVTGFSC